MNQLYQKILQVLPGLDCGLCGHSQGCQGYAKSIVSGYPALDRCLPGGSSLRARLAETMDEQAAGSEPSVAIVQCQGTISHSRLRFHYQGPKTCRAAMLAHGGPKECLYGCLGYGDCVAACPYGALSLTKNGLPKVDFSRCRGCGRCRHACPKGIIKLVPKSQQIYLACLCQAKSDGVSGRCQNGCTSCAVCINACPYGAIGWDGALPKIDFSRCRSCSICVHQCPSKSFIDRIPARPTAFIGLQCNGCQMCKVVCPTDCIVGKKGEHHKVMRGQCIGCGQCFEVCPIRAVTMLGALGHVNLSKY